MSNGSNSPRTPDDLLSASVVRLFGRKVEGVTIQKTILMGSLTNKQLLAQLKEFKGELVLARIYAFSFEGQFYTLPKPTLFLVHDDSVNAKDDTGLANKRDVDFEGDIQRWKYDKDDVMLRGDIVIGTLDDILIDATLSPTSDYPIASRGQLAAQGQVAFRGQLITRGQMMARNRLRE